MPHPYPLSTVRKLCFTLVCLLPLGAASAQKLAVKKGLMTVDGQPYARFESDGGSTFYVSSLQNERLFVVKAMALLGASPAAGNVRYLQYVFTATNLIVETPFPAYEAYYRAITPARQIYAARLFQNGVLDPKAVADFATNNGTPYSDRQRQLVPLPVPEVIGK